MIQVRKSQDRGHARHGWLESYHTFSFADYQDPKFMGFRQLRVINEDWVQPGQGFGTHPHRDMEIITVVVEGALEHKDSMGNGSVIRPGEIQVMSAGTGVTHSEYNPSQKDIVHLLQIWIMPNQRGLKPTYQQRSFSQKTGKLEFLASSQDKSGAAKINQDVELFHAALVKGEKVNHVLKPARHSWIQIIQGSLNANGVALKAGDGAAVSDEKVLELTTINPSEFLLFDIA